MNKEVFGYNASRGSVDDLPTRANENVFEDASIHPDVESLVAHAKNSYPDTAESHRISTGGLPESAEVQEQRLLHVTRLGARVVDFRDLEQVMRNHPNLRR